MYTNETNKNGNEKNGFLSFNEWNAEYCWVKYRKNDGRRRRERERNEDSKWSPKIVLVCMRECVPQCRISNFHKFRWMVKAMRKIKWKTLILPSIRNTGANRVGAPNANLEKKLKWKIWNCSSCHLCGHLQSNAVKLKVSFEATSSTFSLCSVSQQQFTHTHTTCVELPTFCSRQPTRRQFDNVLWLMAYECGAVLPI